MVRDLQPQRRSTSSRAVAMAVSVAATVTAGIALSVAIGLGPRIRPEPDPAPQQLSPIPPPQRSLEVPPIIDPAKTAVLSGFAPLREPRSDKKGSGTGADAPAPDADEIDPRRVVVWIVRPTSARTPRLPDQVLMVNEGGFSPTTLAVTPGTSVELRTTAPGVIVVRGEGLTRLERRLTRATRALPVVPDRVGAIDLTERDYPDAKGLVVCVDSPFLDVARERGEFRLVGIPPGRREVRIRLPNGTIIEKTVDLEAGRELVVDWRAP